MPVARAGHSNERAFHGTHTQAVREPRDRRLSLGGDAVGCSTEATPAEFKAELVKAGFAEKDAQCIIDSMATKGIKISKYTEASTEQTDQVGTIAVDCALKSAGLGGGATGAGG